MNVRSMTIMLLALAASACAQEKIEPRPRAYVSYPQTLDPECRDGQARMYDECGKQSAHFDAALARANADSKVLLVEFGAEWCIWCHVFEAHINGEHSRFHYVHGAPDEPEARYPIDFKEGPGADAQAAETLRQFVAANFVIVHIDAAFAPDGYDILDTTGAKKHFGFGIPFVYTVDSSGQFAMQFDHDAVEKRRDDPKNLYRGYDRVGLLKQLTTMRDAARPAAPRTEGAGP
jgi:thiol-disulfide isomerase/thioredoxin